jgi:hypothetical protein
MIRNLVLVVALLPLGGCYGLAGNDEMDRYFQRSDTMTMSAGDAKQTNAVAHTITPWPNYVGDRRIAYDAQRAGAAVGRYHRYQRPLDQLPNIGKEGEAMGQPPPITTNQNIKSDQNINSINIDNTTNQK